MGLEQETARGEHGTGTALCEYNMWELVGFVRHLRVGVRPLAQLPDVKMRDEQPVRQR